LVADWWFEPDIGASTDHVIKEEDRLSPLSFLCSAFKNIAQMRIEKPPSQGVWFRNRCVAASTDCALNGRTRQRKLRATSRYWLAIVVVCTIWLSGCISILPTRKDPRAAAKNVAAETGLIKPRLADSLDPQAAKHAESRDKSKPEVKQTRNSPDRSDDMPLASAKTVAALESRDAATGDQSGRKADASAKPPRQDSDDALPAKRESVKPAVNPKSADAKQGTGPSGDETKKSEEPAFKKHDHSKYMAIIRDKARDLINKEKDVALARVCRNTITDEWTLTLFRKKQKTYSFVDYAWDEIDDKFEEAFASDQRPISGFKQHLEFSAGDKDCTVLKGSLP